jgi:hypothetical protein
MRLSLLIAIVAIVLNSGWLKAQTREPYDFLIDLTEQINPDSLARTILDLEAFVSRHSLNPNRTEVAAYLRQRLESYGCDIEIDTFPYVDTYSGLTFEQYNVIGKIYGSTSNPAILIGAHHDSCCRTDSSPGADDNASGVAAVIEAARIFSQSGFTPRRTVYFCTWAAEEQGLHGSKNYARKLSQMGIPLDLAINLDMIATNRTTPYKVRIEMSSDISEQAMILSRLNGELGLVQGESTGNSDHASFRQFGYPILYYHEFDFSAHYHTPRDLFIHLDMNYCARISQAALANLAAFASMLQSPTVITAGNSGSGAGIFVEWLPVDGAIGYRARLFNNGDVLLDTLIQNSLSLHFEGLSVSYTRFSLAAVDSSMFEGKTFVKNIQLSQIPLAINGLAAIPRYNEIELVWQKPSELDLKEVIVMIRGDNQTLFDTLARISPGLTRYAVYPDNSQTYYFKLQAVDSLGNFGVESASIGSALARFDRGLLVISDATANQSNFSADSVSRFFAALDSVIPTTVLRAGNTIPNIYKAFQMVLWHSTKAVLSQKMEKNIQNLNDYIQSGGGLVISTDYPQKLLSPASPNSATYPPQNPVYSLMHISQTSYVDGSNLAIAQSSTAPVLRVDPGKVSVSQNGNLREFCSLQPVLPLVPLYSSYTSTAQNQMNNRTVGIVSFADPKLCVLGVPLFFFRHQDVTNFIQYLAGQGFYSSIYSPVGAKKSFSIYPNPAGHELNVVLHDNSRSVRIEIFNLQGGKLISVERKRFGLPNPEVIALDISGLTAGAYIVHVNGEAALFMKN